MTGERFTPARNYCKDGFGHVYIEAGLSFVCSDAVCLRCGKTYAENCQPDPNKE